MMGLLLCFRKHNILFSFFFLILLHSASPALATVEAATASRTTISIIGGDQTDKMALLAFKARITHDPLGVLSFWNDSLHFCQWPGVTCSGRHSPKRATLLDLSSQGLEGSISPDIGNLSFVGEIRLLNNSLHGEIPQEIGRLFRLRALDLSNNSLEGQIPSNLSRCSNLMLLALNHNHLGGNIPVQLGSLVKLEVLRLNHNNLTGDIPPSLGNLSTLVSLSVSINNLEGSIPESFGRLTRLTFLALGANRLSGTIPPSMYNLSLITTFSVVANNYLEGSLPFGLGLTLPNLQVLNIGGNQFSGPIPVSLSNLSKLEFLDINGNNFTGKVPIDFMGLGNLSWLALNNNHLGSGDADDLSFMDSLVNCTSLQLLGLDGNHFGGVLPSSISNLSINLGLLTLGDNQISGRIPEGIGNLVNLNVLGIELNQLTGNIPNSIGMLQNLVKLSLHRNSLSGQIPSSLGNLTLLTVLGLSINNFSGSIPPSIGNCQNLIFLDLSENNLTGAIPKQVIGISSLSIFLILSHNHLTGPLPMEVGNLKNLVSLDLSENKLFGEIPDTLGNCVRLQYLSLQGNFFQGPIPPSLRFLTGIEEMDLSRNNFSGKISKYLENLPSLLWLNLSFNDLQDEIPVKGLFQNASSFSIIGNSRLCGGIPELHLQACPVHELKEQGMSLASKLKIAIGSGVVLVCSILLIVLVLYWTKKSKKTLSSTSLKDGPLKISYKELLEATSGFSSSNLIGAGGFGSVYKGILGDRTLVAVKVLNLQQGGAFKSFLAECESLRNIRHRNLLKIVTSCSSIDFKGNEFKALVYEFMINGSLDMWLHPNEDDAEEQLRNLSLFQRLNIAIDVASALDYLHNHCQVPVVHCDLKPSNVLLDGDFTAHVGDFGLSKFLSENNGKISLNQTASSIGLRGSVGYTAPGITILCSYSCSFKFRF
uniref:non-specific serine/threonine protein kinase n=1 Tax=Nelumbo nucifera TaxID=4432 RepID=A0A822Z0R3_NELNU|nr:TPA_asm: hypothetical protein HUJ06_007706 [Nelumbo nucifera]